jgi:hypothetical protein
VTISQYAPQPDGFPIIMDDDGDLNSSPDYDGDNCGPDGGLTCHYIYLDRVDFGSITTAGCSGMTAKYYITSWGGALDADGDPLPTFTDNPPLGQYDAGDHQDFRMDEGYLGEAYCIEGYIEDSSGCRTYFAIPTGHDMAAGFPDEPRFHPTCETP